MIMTCLSVSNNTCMDHVITLCSNSDHLVGLLTTPQISLNFRHLLSCSTIETVPHLYFFPHLYKVYKFTC